jgi:repressor LexA
MKKNSVNTINERIILLRKQYAGGRGKSKFARDLSLSPSTYSYYENDRVPPAEILAKICRLTGADLSWLLTGEQSEKQPVIQSILTARRSPNTEILQKIDTLLSNNPEIAGAIDAFVDLLAEKTGVAKDIASSVGSGCSLSNAAHPGWIPILGRTAAGIVHRWDETFLSDSSQAVTELEDLVRKHIGKDIVGTSSGSLSVDLQAKPLVEGFKEVQANLVQVSGEQPDEIVEFLQCEKIYEMFPDSFGLRIDGDSMSPRINDGDIIVVSPSVPAVQGCAAVAHLSNQIGVTCKLVRTRGMDVHLIPINERYETKVVAKKDLLWALAVLCHVKA